MGFSSQLIQRRINSCLVCVCVEHLNRCKTSTIIPNWQGACGHHANACQRSYAWWWKQSLINSVYLRFLSQFLRHFDNGTRPSPKPHHRVFDFVYVCRNLNLLWFYSTGLSFSPLQKSLLNFGWITFDLVFVLPFPFSYTEFPMNTSLRTPLGLCFVGSCIQGIQFQPDPMKDQFLSSVISMVAPTWCHGPIWGNPVGRLLTEWTSEFTVLI